MRVDRYAAACKPQWDAFVRKAKNGTFLMLRDYLDYHADRFSDHSLIVRDDEGNPIALLPANEDESTLVSHAGITYAGVISDKAMTTLTMLEVFAELHVYMRRQGLALLRYKTVPHIYHSAPAEEDRHALHVQGARLYRRDVLSVLAHDERLPFSTMRARRVAKARNSGLAVVPTTDFAAYWPLLEENLRSAHDAAPVHSLAEITLLSRRFPDNIRLFVCVEQGVAVAGVVVYDSGRVARAQYIGSNARGRETGALDLLFCDLIESHFAGRRFFDFGSSQLDGGPALNEGLVRQKEGFGARAIVHDFYDLPIQ